MISYEPLFKTMKEKQISSYALYKKGFPRSTFNRIQHGKSISVNTVNQLCKILNCSVYEIIEYVEEPVEKN